jgi:lipopolysaccharide transport system ATP-binding protein
LSKSDIAVSIRNLGKSYTITHDEEKHITLAETILSRLKNPLRRPRTETFWALQDVSFEVKKGDVVGIIGRNGAGKSTLLKVLSRITEPTRGEVDVYGRVGSLLEVGTGFHPELTGRENIYLNGAILGMTKGEIRRQFDAIVDFAGVEQFIDTPVKRFSSGMYVRLAFAVAAHLNPEILIVDEVLAVGDAEFQKKCLGKMKDVAGHGRTVLFVSHNVSAIKDLCNKGIYLASGRVAATGEIDTAIKAYLGGGIDSKIEPERGPVKRLSIIQENETLVLEADWQHTEALTLPNLGFVIYNSLGVPVVGANPWLMGIDAGDLPRDRGHIKARLTEPRLLDGNYYLSVWFGDGRRDIIELAQCVAFEGRGMAGPRQNLPAIVGSVAPRCEFAFSGAST